MSATEQFWLNLTNIGLGVAVAVVMLAIAVAGVLDVIRRQRKARDARDGRRRAA